MQSSIRGPFIDTKKMKGCENDYKYNIFKTSFSLLNGYYKLVFVPSGRSVCGQGLEHTLSGTPERCFTPVGSGLARKNLTRPEWPARDKHSSLLGQ
jgi:hypothetical protein